MEPNLQDTPKIAPILNLGKAQLFAWALCLLIALGPAASLGQVPSDRRPELVLQTGHTGSVHAVAFSPDGKWLASGGSDSIVCLWEANSGRLVRTLVAHGSAVVDVTFSPDGKWLASASWDHTVRVWEVNSGRQQLTLTGHDDSVTALAFSPDGHQLATAGSDKTVKLWEIATAREQQTLRGHTGSVNALAFSPDGRQLATASWDKTIKLWDVAAGKELGTLTGYSEVVTTIAFSPDGRWLASGGGSKGGRDTTAKLWDVSSGSVTHSLVGHTGSVEAVVFSPDGRWLASGSWDRTVKVWEVASGREQRTMGGHVVQLLATAFSASGRFLAAGSFDKTIKLWDLTGRQVLHSFVGHPSQILSVAFSPDGRVVAAGSSDSTTTLWDVATGQKLRTLTGPTPPTGGTYFVLAVAFSPDGRWLVSAGMDYRIRLWDATTGRQVRVFTGHTSSVYAVAFSTDGRWLASGSEDKTVRLWDVASGKQLRSFSGHDAPVWTVAFDPIGNTIASGDVKGLVKIRDIATGRELQSFEFKKRVRVAFSPNGRWLACGGDKSIELRDLNTGRLLRTLIGHGGEVTDVIFRPDGGSLASASRDGTVRLWNVTTGEELVLVTATQVGSDWVAITPEGLFDGSSQGTEKVIAWRIGNRVYPPERFFNSYFTPGLLTEIFSGKRPRPAIDIAKLKLPPDVVITSPDTNVSVQNTLIPLTAECTDQGGGIKEVRLYHNGKHVNTQEGRVGSRTSYTFQIDLVPSDNFLGVKALSTEQAESNLAEVRVVYKVPETPKPNLYLFLVGINRYSDPKFDLQFARGDIESILRFFQERGHRLFASVHPVVLYDEKATKDSIKTALDQLARETKKEDVLLIYLVGHGVGVDQQFYFLAHEMKEEEDEETAYRKYGVSATAIGEALYRAPALKQVLILDTCESEAALPVLTKLAFFKARGPDVDKALKVLARSRGIYLIAASTQLQRAYEVKQLGHGVLTSVLLEGLGEKEQPKAEINGMVTAGSLATYVNQQVPELTEKYLKGKKQYPVTTQTGMDFPLAVR